MMPKVKEIARLTIPMTLTPSSLKEADRKDIFPDQNVTTRSVSPWFAENPSVYEKRDYIVAEVPVALVYNGVSHAVMMASPEDLRDFAYGFSLSEGIIEKVTDVYALDVVTHQKGLEVQLTISNRCFAHLQQRRRQLSGNSGCGVCGLESLDQFQRTLPRLPKSMVVSHEAVQKAIRKLDAHQKLQRLTGSSHAAAWCNENGGILELREDVGRHNALDKLIGARAQKDLNSSFNRGFVIVSSRASHEMVEKAVLAGVEILVAVSAATSLAIDSALQSNLTLVGFARQERHVVYCGESRLATD
jgi:FdhD protein